MIGCRSLSVCLLLCASRLVLGVLPSQLVALWYRSNTNQFPHWKTFARLGFPIVAFGCAFAIPTHPDVIFPLIPIAFCLCSLIGWMFCLRYAPCFQSHCGPGKLQPMLVPLERSVKLEVLFVLQMDKQNGFRNDSQHPILTLWRFRHKQTCSATSHVLKL